MINIYSISTPEEIIFILSILMYSGIDINLNDPINPKDFFLY